MAFQDKPKQQSHTEFSQADLERACWSFSIFHNIVREKCWRWVLNPDCSNWEFYAIEWMNLTPHRVGFFFILQNVVVEEQNKINLLIWEWLKQNRAYRGKTKNHNHNQTKQPPNNLLFKFSRGFFIGKPQEYRRELLSTIGNRGVKNIIY